MYNLLTNYNASLKDITLDEKRQIIELLDLEIGDNKIEFEKISIPKVYRDIYYNIYFSISDIQKTPYWEDYFSKDLNKYLISFNFLKNNKNKQYYCCTISEKADESIELLENIYDK